MQFSMYSVGMCIVCIVTSSLPQANTNNSNNKRAATAAATKEEKEAEAKVDDGQL